MLKIAKCKWKKYYAVIVTVIMMVSMFTMNHEVVYAEELTTGVNITDVILKVDGVVVNENTTEPIEQEEDVSISYSWEIDNAVTINDGDYIEVEVPEGLRIANNVSGDLDFDGNDPLGTFFLDKDTRLLRLTFNNEVTENGYLNVSAKVQLNTRFELDTLSSENPVSITFPLIGVADKTIKLKFKPAGVSSSIEKHGAPNKGINPTKIDWVVDVNKTLSEQNNIIVEDIFEAGLEYDSNSLVIKHLLVDLDGDETVGAIVDLGDYTVSTPDELTLQIDLGDINSGYRLYYSTSIIDMNRTSFENIATYGNNSSEATVSVERGTRLEKEGSLDRDFNPNTITWTIYANKYEDHFINMMIEDTIEQGLSYVLGSAIVYEIELDDDGLVSNLVNLGDLSGVLSIDENDLLFSLGTTSKAYKITYETDITDEATLSFDNTVTLKDGEEASNDETYSATATVDFQRGVLLSKKAKNHIGYTDKYISWTIDANTLEADITGAVLTDTIGSDLVIDQTTVAVYAVTFNPDGSDDLVTLMAPQPIINYSVGDTVMTISLGNISGAIRVIYDTDITNLNHSGKFINDVKLTGTIDGEGIGDGGLGYDVTKKMNPNITNSISKKTVTEGLNYLEKTMSWAIKLKPKKESMRDVVLIDAFPNGGLTFLPSTLQITKGSTLLAEGVGNDYILEQIDGDWTNGFKVTFLTEVDLKNHVIVYETGFDRLIHTNSAESSLFKNKVDVTWIGTEEGDPNASYSASKTTYYTITSEADNNGSKSGTLRRNKRKIDWVINANYLAEPMTEMTIGEVVMTNQELDMTRIKVYEYEVQPNGSIVEGSLVSSTAYTISDMTESGFTIRFDGVINEPYRIKYTTKLVGQSQSSYPNTANMNGTHLSASVAYENSEVFIDKEGLQDGDIVEWIITVNKSLSTIQNARVKDILNIGHEYVQESLRVYLEPEHELVDSSDYDLIFTIVDFVTREQYFELYFNDTIEAEYTIEYQTEINLDVNNGEAISNSVTLTGEGVTIENKTSTEEIIVEVTAGFGSSRGVKGGFRIEKEDGDDANIKLENVRFELLDENHLLIGELPLTDENGLIIVDRTHLGTYYIREVESLEGYQLPENNLIEIVIEDGDEVVVPIMNYTLRSLKIIKSDKSNGTLLLEGAEFTIYGPVDSESATTRSVITDLNGEVQVDELLFGEYIITEVKAPSGYRLDSEPINLVIGTDQVIYVLTVENTRESTSSKPQSSIEEPEEELEEPETEEAIEESIEEEKVPEAPADEVTFIDIEEDIPEGTPELPATSGVPSMVYYVIGILLIVYGRKKRG